MIRLQQIQDFLARPFLAVVVEARGPAYIPRQDPVVRGTEFGQRGEEEFVPWEG